MACPETALAGYRGMRAELLVTLKKRQPLTARELATAFGLTPNALRRHLKSLEEAELVRYRPVVRGVGAPVYAYSLSEAGEALFPRAYAPALADALDAVRAELGAEGVRRVFARHWETAAGGAAEALAGFPFPERAQLLAELLTAEGYMAEAEQCSPTEVRLKVFNCAIREVASRFPEVCEVEERFLERALGATLERRDHIAGGCNACTYHVTLATNPARAGAGARSAEGREEQAGQIMKHDTQHDTQHDIGQDTMAVAQEKA